MSHDHHKSHDADDDRARALHVGVGLASPLWTAFWVAAGAGAAYWWWTAMGRTAAQSGAISALPAPLGPSPEPARPSPAGQSGEAPVEVAPPELVMAHVPPPPAAPDHPAHPSDRAIPEPPPEMLAHTPPESVGVSFKPGTGFENPTHDPKSVFPKAPNEGDGPGGGGVESEKAVAPPPRVASTGANPAAQEKKHSSSEHASSEASAHVAGAVRPAPVRLNPPKLDGVGEAAAPAVILATPPGQPVFDPEALATETSVAALTAGEDMDQTAVPTEAIGEPSPAPPPKPRSRKKPGVAPEE